MKAKLFITSPVRCTCYLYAYPFTARVEELILRLRDDGIAVLIISHNFDQVMRLSNRVWVMRSGYLVGGRRTEETNGTELVAMITGASEEQIAREE